MTLALVLAACLPRYESPDDLEGDTGPVGTGPALEIELEWTLAGDDLDLHLLQRGGVLGTGTDCHWQNCTAGLDWGQPGEPGDDPALVQDDVQGTGPERIVLEQPGVDGPYTVVVVDFENGFADGGAPNLGRVTVTMRGQEVWSGPVQFAPGSEGAAIEVCRVDTLLGTVVAL